MPLRYESNPLLLVVGLILAAATVVIYAHNYDILVPELPGGSYRMALGDAFALPAVLMMLAQVVVSSAFLYSFAISLGGMPDYVKSLFLAALLTFLFSLTYVFYPDVGPFYYIFFSSGGGPPFVLFVEVGWTLLVLLTGTLLLHRMNSLPLHRSLLAILVAYLFINVVAS